MAQGGLLDSAHDCSEGGIAVALSESTFAKGIGISVDLASDGLPAEFALFGEDASRVIISCDHGNLTRIQQIAVKYALTSNLIGETSAQRLEIKLDGEAVVSASVEELYEAYECALEKALRTETVVAGLSS
jgi:phosphoribosylformylglycinamidine synthase subunit PurL